MQNQAHSKISTADSKLAFVSYVSVWMKLYFIQ